MNTRNILLAGVLATAGLGAGVKVAQYRLIPRGDVDGLILSDGTEVHTPPHPGAQFVAAVKPGDAVTIHGLRARNLPLVQAMQVSNDAGGATVTDTGPGEGPHGPGGPDARAAPAPPTNRC